MNTALVEQLKTEFSLAYDTKPSCIVKAPGRVNLIGEHTDYNDGFVLPCALDFAAYVAVTKRDDQEVHVSALDYNKESCVFHINQEIKFDLDYMWSNYIRGIFQVLIEQGYRLSGVSLMLVGDVPQGAGLSSSAALEVGVTLALSSLFNLELSSTDIALIAQKAENDFVGCQCGIMDQFASAKSERQHALLIDCRTLLATSVKLPQELSILVIHSGVQRGLVDSAYNQRRKECEQAAEYFAVPTLRDLTLDEVLTQQEQMDELIFKRAKHVVSENERVLSMVRALQTSDLKQISQLMRASHYSLDQDYEVTVEPLNILVDLIHDIIGEQGGVRMTGGGFGGCVVALCPHDMVDAVNVQIKTHYTQQSGLKATVYRCSAEQGAQVLLADF